MSPTIATAIANAAIAFLENLPTVVKTVEQLGAYVAEGVADFKKLLSNDATTQADIDATIAAINERSAQIQAID